MGDCDSRAGVSQNNEIESEDIIDVGDALSIVPFQENTFAVCELCGFVGNRELFYRRNNKYCTFRCHVSGTRRKHCNWKFKVADSSRQMAGRIPLEPIPQLEHWTSSPNGFQVNRVKPQSSTTANNYEWSQEELFGCDFLAAPVHLFKHAPLCDMWDDNIENMKVEVQNPDGESVPGINDYRYWVATVVKVKGYMGLIRYEGISNNLGKDFWVNICGPDVHPIGWCASRGKPLIPPQCIEAKFPDWRRFLIKQLSGARSLPINLKTKFAESIKSHFSVGTVLEVVDKNKISQVKVASIHESIGRRLHIKYYDSVPEDNGFWCHEESPLIHPVGWAFKVGHHLDAPESYCQRVATGSFHENDARPGIFRQFSSIEPTLFQVGMKLEAIDPLNLSAICVATVMKILNDGYMMIRIDNYSSDDTGADWFCYHQRSPCIFPAGFCAENDLKVVPPFGWDPETFTWAEYLSTTDAVAAPLHLFAARLRVLGFVVGMRLECADLMDPRLVCVATVAKVVIDLLKIHFDGWGDEYDQWLWAHSTDMYPVGWCKAVGFRLEGPNEETSPLPMAPPPPPPKKPKTPKTPKTIKRKRGRAPAGRSITKIAEKSHDETAVSTPTKTNNYSLRNHAESNSIETSIYNSMPTETETLDTNHENDLILIETNTSRAASPEIIYTEETGTNLIQISSKTAAAKFPRLIPDNVHIEACTSLDDDPPKLVIKNSEDKFIPRIVNDAVLTPDMWNKVTPESWSAEDVAIFFANNNCKQYSHHFSDVTGPILMQLSKEKILEKVQNKVGPSLKVIELINLLTAKKGKPVKPPFIILDD